MSEGEGIRREGEGIRREGEGKRREEKRGEERRGEERRGKVSYLSFAPFQSTFCAMLVFILFYC